MLYCVYFLLIVDEFHYQVRNEYYHSYTHPTQLEKLNKKQNYGVKTEENLIKSSEKLSFLRRNVQ